MNTTQFNFSVRQNFFAGPLASNLCQPPVSHMSHAKLRFCHVSCPESFDWGKDSCSLIYSFLPSRSWCKGKTNKKSTLQKGVPMTENQIEQNQKLDPPPEQSRLPVRSKIEILFEFSVPKPKLTFYRAVKAIDGSFRVEKRGEHAKKFRSIMSCGAEQSLFKFRESVESYFRK